MTNGNMTVERWTDGGDMEEVEVEVEIIEDDWCDGCDGGCYMCGDC